MIEPLVIAGLGVAISLRILTSGLRAEPIARARVVRIADTCAVERCYDCVTLNDPEGVVPCSRHRHDIVLPAFRITNGAIYAGHFESGYTRPVPTSMPGPAERVSR